MNTQHLETPAEPETYQPVAHPESPTVTEEDETARQLPTVTEAQQAFEQIKAKRRGRWFRSGVQSAFCSKGTVQDPDQLLQRDFDEVLTLLREESQKRDKRKKLFIGVFLCIVVLAIGISIFTHNPHLFNNFGAYVGLISMGAAASQQQKSAALAIATFDEVRAVGPLAEALEFQDKEVARMAAQSLICLLPRLKASDAHFLSPEQRFCLNRALRGKNIELILAILKALEQVGDTKAIEEVEKLAAGRGHGGHNPKVVAAAQECLPFLRQSAERQQIGSQLLRPSDGNLASSDILLRPAMPHASTEPADQLLRPTNDAV